ncbi:hypothetical protein GOB43_31860 [Sinorhizobium meliloti]|nr:hypothetical protein [Sinorhizobium meliloti]
MAQPRYSTEWGVNAELRPRRSGNCWALTAESEKYSYASSGKGTPLHLSGELFNKMVGVEMQPIRYKGSGPALKDVLGNQVPTMFDNLPSSSDQIKAGTLRALAVTTAERASSFPDIPTITESGIPGYEIHIPGMRSSLRPTPQPVIARLNEAPKKAMADPAVRKRMEEFSVTIVASMPEELA